MSSPVPAQSQSIRFTIEQVSMLAESLSAIATAAQRAAAVVIDAGAVQVQVSHQPRHMSKLEAAGIAVAAPKPKAAVAAKPKPKPKQKAAAAAAPKQKAKLADRQAAGVAWSAVTVAKLAGQPAAPGVQFQYTNKKGALSRWDVVQGAAPVGKVLCVKAR